jgi:hypothetical protein
VSDLFRSSVLPGILAVALASSTVAAQDLMPMDLTQVDPALVGDMFGDWVISDAAGEKTCAVTLGRDETIGGRVIDIDPACAGVFPVMDQVFAWRLMEGWSIDLVDAERHLLIRFSTPDDRYVAFPETDGIFTILKP